MLPWQTYPVKEESTSNSASSFSEPWVFLLPLASSLSNPPSYLPISTPSWFWFWFRGWVLSRTCDCDCDWGFILDLICGSWLLLLRLWFELSLSVECFLFKPWPGAWMVEVELPDFKLGFKGWIERFPIALLNGWEVKEEVEGCLEEEEEDPIGGGLKWEDMAECESVRVSGLYQWVECNPIIRS